MKRLLGLLMAVMVMMGGMASSASAATFSAWEGDVPHTVVSEEVAAQIAEDTAVENGFRLNDVTLMHAVTQLVKEDGTGRPVWVVSRTYMDNDTEQIHQYHAAIDAQTGDMQYDTKFYFEKVHDWENELQCDNEFWPYEKRYLFDHLYNFTPSMAMPEESLLTMEEVRLVCDYKIREWSDFAISQEELNKYTMSARFYKSEGDSLGKWFVFYYLLDADTPRYQLEFAYQVNFEEGTLDAVVYSWEDAQHSRG